ncbi:sugar ABC transporter permease [Cohnella sp. LGH]|uniref:Putative aldouronate transport system permease protein n=1 Tax=Cohnella phaseoli TaxID=456490 RepID=A0A3D9KGT8_9BACL|nr:MULTISPECIES: ABC transporter permease subunit [Cohnella]QTH43766.1 sugar ABC transporter permease [Cohnella sp. LGH]RED85068.1 putative aldouronate transport system permease protein [Cohnella phaseoli]
MKAMKALRELPLHLMLLPGALIVFVYCYVPMVGVTIAFQQFVPVKGLFGSEWIGLDNFRYVLNMPDIGRVVWNTLFISVMKIVAGLTVPIAIAILLNEVRLQFFKKTFQTLVYLPHFLSWIIISGILIDILSPSEGVVNRIVQALGGRSVFFLGDNGWFPFTLVASDVWKEFGFSTIVYLAAITGINPSLYEAAVMDGAGRWKQMRHVTLPGMLPVIVLLATLSLGNVLNAGFEQVFNLYSPSVYESGDILDTLIYRIGILDAQFGVATAIGLLKSFVSLILISLSYFLAYRLANYRIF